MRKFFMALFLSTVLIFLYACTNEHENNSIDPNGYVYGSNPNDGSMLKYNVKTGNVSHLCPDPLCDHKNNDCLFRNVCGEIAFYKEKLYYMVNLPNEDDSFQLREYDITTNNIQNIYTSSNPINGIFIENNFLFFWNYVYIDNKNIDLGADLVRINLLSRKTKTLTDIPVTEENKGSFFYKINDRLYWQSFSGEGYSTTFDYTDKKNEEVNGRVDNGYEYIRTRNSEKITSNLEARCYKLERKNIATGEIETICENLDNYIILDNMIYYIAIEKNPKFICENTKTNIKYYNYYGGKIYVMNLDGGNKRILCEVKNCDIFLLKIFKSYSMVVGDYLGFTLCDYEEHFDSSTYGLSPNLLIVNIKTGEYKIATYNDI